MVGGRGINCVDVPRNRTKTKIRKARNAFCINEDIWLGKIVCQSKRNNKIIFTYALQISVDNLVSVEIVEAAGDPNQLHSSQNGIKFSTSLRHTKSKRSTSGFFPT